MPCLHYQRRMVFRVNERIDFLENNGVSSQTHKKCSVVRLAEPEEARVLARLCCVGLDGRGGACAVICPVTVDGYFGDQINIQR